MSRGYSGLAVGGRKVRAVKTHQITRWGAFATAVVLGAGIGLAGPATANAAETERAGSYARGQFLSGSLAGINLDRIAKLNAAQARNNGSQSSQVAVDPLSLTVLNAVNVSARHIRVDPEAIADVGEKTDGGVLSQYAKANNDGSALAASGAIGGGGAIGPNASNPGGSLTLDIDSLLNSRFDAVIKDVALEVQAIAAQAKGTPSGAVSGTYSIEGLKLTFTSPVLGRLDSIIDDSLDPIDARIAVLSGSKGLLADDTVGLLRSVNPALNLTGSKADVSVRVKADLDGVLNDLLDHSYGNSGVRINLKTGQVTVDLEKVIGGNLNGKAAGYDVLNDGAVGSIVRALTATVSDLADDVVTRVDHALRNARVDIDADLQLLKGRADLTKRVCKTIEIPVEDGDGGLLGGLLGGVGSIVKKLVCHTVSTPRSPLQTSVRVDVHGTVQQILNGNAPASVSAKVLSIPVSVSTGRLLGSLKGDLVDRLFDSNGVVNSLAKTLDSKLVDRVNGDLLGNNSLTSVLSNVVSVTLNNKATMAGTFTETALTVAVLPSVAAGGLATVNLATATVSPNLAAGEDPDDPDGSDNPDNPGDNPDDPDGSSNPDNPGDGSGGGSGVDYGSGSGTGLMNTSANGSLAFTGMDLVGLIALITALLATGTAIAAREHYRRTHTDELPIAEA